MTPDTRRDLTAIRQMTARIRANKQRRDAARRTGQTDDVECLTRMCARLEEQVMERLDRLERSGALIAVEALVSNATRWAQAGERDHG